MNIWMAIIPLFIGAVSVAQAADKKTTFFDCTVKETYQDAKKKKRTVSVHVYFAVEGLDSYGGDNELVTYPGISEEDSEEMGLIVVRPEELPNGSYPLMSNLNGQGGDLRVYSDSGNIRLFGDGSGYQFTDLVLWGAADSDEAVQEGYVRDYGPTYGSTAPFKQFISCKAGTKPFKLAKK